jgi:hypothetical protein
MLKEFSILLKIYTSTLIVPPSSDTVHHFLSQITNSVVTLCSTKVYILLFCLACRTLHVDIKRSSRIWHSSDPVSLVHCCFDMYTCIKEEGTLFTKYRPTRGMNIHIYTYMFNKDKDTITYTYNMSFICSVWLICFNTSSYDICIT